MLLTQQTALQEELGMKCHNRISWFMVFDVTVNNISVISCLSVLLVEETVVPGENHRLVASH